MRKLFLGLGACSLALLLTSCSSYGMLENEATAGDELPSQVLEQADNIDPKTSRLAGQDDGVSFWLARGTNKKDICLVVFKSDDEWGASCGRGMVTYKSALGKFVVHTDNEDPPSGATAVSKNIYRLL